MARCSRPRSGNDASIIGRFRNGAGTLTKVFVRINGETHYLWRAVDHEGEVLEVFATKRRAKTLQLQDLRLRWSHRRLFVMRVDRWLDQQSRKAPLEASGAIIASFTSYAESLFQYSYCIDSYNRITQTGHQIGNPSGESRLSGPMVCSSLVTVRRIAKCPPLFFI